MEAPENKLPENATMGQRIRYCRESLNMRRATLERLSGVARCSIAYYERDDMVPSVFSLMCLADVFDVSMDWLAGRKQSDREEKISQQAEKIKGLEIQNHALKKERNAQAHILFAIRKALQEGEKEL